MEHETALQPGAPFGSYQIVRVLGRGAFGAVYEARRLPIDKPVALKVLHAQHAGNASIVRRFLQEAQAVAQMQHPHIVDTSDLGTVDGCPFLAMELLLGETLESRLRRSLSTRKTPLTLTEAADLLLPVVSAVAAVHAMDIVHRDLKPENIFLAQQRGVDCPKLLDFGIAKFHAPPDGSATATGTMLGSPLYMAPEQYRESRSVGPAADLWSLGVILYRLCTGVHPFRRGTYIDVYESVCNDVVTPPSRVQPSLPEAFDQVVMFCLVRDATRRIPSALRLGAALLPFASPAVQHNFRQEFAHHDDTLPPLPVVAPGPLVSSPPPAEATAAQGSPLGATSLGPMDVVVPPAPRRPYAMVLGGAALLGAIGLSLGTLYAHKASDRTGPAAVVTPLTPYALSVRVEPAHGTLRLDAEPPVVGALQRSLPRTGRPHRLTASAPGYVPSTVTFGDDDAVPPVLRLEASPVPTPPAVTQVLEAPRPAPLPVLPTTAPVIRAAGPRRTAPTRPPPRETPAPRPTRAGPIPSV